ncbi:MAG: hypothetical protein A2015_14730 [Spirochaetes bacterium GWF1_31_7]|nr:MAG: hypothetical protein A2Y30_10415 [Spirochaetes bacterium GWE1_32_154]OHD47090.1 MAG: hypothetical protein A2Y29_02190 [Spirochaetes bacterium GWE2_31_10]OHD51733.1 MAG: hypothetical protein A2015_14730 [Spirochaetes bacterium GWF1_31_7]OHD76844.1 MAG: hypothetical protein A2355_05505 [Spirochaetes bacterium RIFOXYB1_FULL_32_8]HBD92676.1 hypothetical protein [Spirochaetia bacterium]
MMRKLSILVVLFIFCGYMSYPKPKDKLKTNKLYVIGRINTGIDLGNFFNGIDSKKLFLRMIFHRDPDAIFPAEKQIWNGNNYRDDGYFILAVPREKLYLIHSSLVPVVSLGDQIILEYNLNLTYDFKNDDRVIYVGDIFMKYEGEKTFLSIKDNYSEALENCSEFLQDSNGDFIKPRKSLFIGNGEVESRRVTVRPIIYIY